MNSDLPMTAERLNDRKPIWVFTPSRTEPKDLEFILVQRQKLLQDAVERVQESALTGHKHHLLFIGPRGCGKTHLVTLIVHRLGQEKELADRLRIAWLNEDETCTTLLELLLKIHAALDKRYPEEYREEMLSPAYELKQDAALEFVSKHLLTSLDVRTLLVVVENLDAIFEGLGDIGQKQLRAFIQENPKLSIVATAQRLVENLSNRSSPFFGFFQTEHLKPLNVVEATELLKNIAKLNKQDGVAEFLSTSRGRSRVQALHHLSGGNHRIYIVLSQFINRDSINALVGPFMKMVDELTPYYQERVRWLPPLQRKIVKYLCSCEGTVPVKEIAKRLFSTSQTISSQLQDLRAKGYVVANQRGRESLYETSEPLMRICVEVKENQRNQPLRLLVDFLRVWYDERDLSDRLGNLEPASASRASLESAVNRGITDGQADETQRVVDDFTAVIKLPDASVEEVAKALLNRGVTSFRSNDKQGSQKDFETVIHLANAPAKLVVDAYLALSELHCGEGRWSEGFEALDAGIGCGAKAQPPDMGIASGLISLVFSAGLSPEARRAKVASLLDVYKKHQALSVLGEGIVTHIGSVFRAGEPFPSLDNLEQWAAAWEQAAASVDEFRLSLRLLRTGVDFVKAGGHDPGVLLALTATEREILKQGFRVC